LGIFLLWAFFYFGHFLLWAFFYFGNVFESWPHFWAIFPRLRLLINYDKYVNVFLSTFWAIFPQTYLVTLLSTKMCVTPFWRENFDGCILKQQQSSGSFGRPASPKILKDLSRIKEIYHSEMCGKKAENFFCSSSSSACRKKSRESSEPGLPDAILSNQKYQFGKISEGLGMEKVGIFYGHLEYR
jgi:hypothetical protein